MTDDSAVLAYRARDTNEAVMIVQALDEAGVEAMKSGGAAGQAAFGDLGADAFLVEIWVKAEEAERAKRVIVDWLERSPGSGADWVCPSCGEDNDAGFDVCWKCQALPA